MRKAIFILLFVLPILLSTLGCGSATPDNKTYASDSTRTGWYAAKPVYEHTVLIKPTWSQSFHYAREGGWGFWLTISIMLLAMLCVFGYLAAADNLPKLFDNVIIKSIILGVLAVGALASFAGQPGSLKLNNDQWVPKEQYDYYMSTQGNITPIWDSLANNCHMPWGPDKGCKGNKSKQ